GSRPGTTAVAQKLPMTMPAPATRASFPPRDISRDLREFREVSERAFDGQISWMLVSQNDSDIGVASGPLPPDQKILLLRLALSHGDETISNSDLIVLAGQKADVTLPLSAGQSLHYHISTSAENPTHLTLGLELKA